MSTFVRRLEILNFLNGRKDSRAQPVSTEQLIRHLDHAGYLDDLDIKEKSTLRLIQRDLQFLLGEQDEEGEFENDFGLCRHRGDGNSWYWSMDPYQTLSYDFESMPAYVALALSLTQKHLKQVLPERTQEELAHIFSSAEQRLLSHTRKLSSSDYLRLAESVEFYQRGQSLRSPEFDMALLDKVYQAILVGKCLHITYRSLGGAKEYVLHPYGVAIMLPKIYLIAKKEGDASSQEEGFRHFLVHKIVDVYLLDKACNVPDHFKLSDYLNAGNMEVLIDRSDPNLYPVRVRLFVEDGSNLLEDLRDSPISQDQQLEEQTDGTWVLTASTRRSIQFRNWLLSLGTSARIEEPKVFVEDLLHHLNSQQASYLDSISSS